MKEKEHASTNGKPSISILRVYRSKTDEYEWWTPDLDKEGTDLDTPEGWDFLPSGDAYLTRKVKSLGPHWVVLKKGSRKMGRSKQWYTSTIGVLAPRANIEKADEMARRTADKRAMKREVGRKVRGKVEEKRRRTFELVVHEYLGFAPEHDGLARKIARETARHALEVGSGRVGRTLTIEEEEKARLAVRAHIRHNYTDYEEEMDRFVGGGMRDSDIYDGLRSEAEQKVTRFIEKHRN